VVTELDEAELKEFRDAAAPLYEDFPAEIQTIIKRIQAA
jgi:hypothetical protein